VQTVLKHSCWYTIPNILNIISSRKMVASIPILWLLLFDAAAVVLPSSATSDGTLNYLLHRVGVVASNLRGSLGESNNVMTTKSLSSTPIAPRFMSIIEYHASDATEDSSSASVTLPLHVFLSDTPRLLDNVTRFEQAAIAFISDNTNDATLMSKDSVVRFTSAFVVEQVLTWDEDTSRIGLDVNFQVQVDSSVPNIINYNRLKKATQRLLDTRNDMFQIYLEKSPREINDGAELFTITQLLRPITGFATAAVGLCGIIVSVMFLCWKMKINQLPEREGEESKPTEINSKPTLETSESYADNDYDSYLEESVTFPMTYHEKQPEEWDDVSGPGGGDDSTDDGSFNASVVFCPSVELRGHELSTIRANIEDNTDSDSDEENASTPLSPESLQEFDTAIRRAEF